MTRTSLLIVGSLLGLLTTYPPAIAQTQTIATAKATDMWNRSPDRVHYTFRQLVFGAKDYLYTCKFLDPVEGASHDPVRFCGTESGSGAQVFTRDIDGRMQAMSVVIDLGINEPNTAAKMIDATVLIYLLGKTDDGDAAVEKAHSARRRILADLKTRPKVTYTYDDATITASVRGREIHVDVDKPVDLTGDE